MKKSKKEPSKKNSKKQREKRNLDKKKKKERLNKKSLNSKWNRNYNYNRLQQMSAKQSQIKKKKRDFK